MSPHSLWLITAALAAILILILLIASIKLHPFLALLMVSISLGLIVGMPASSIVHSFEVGVGNILGHVAVVVTLGTILGKMMAESGGAERVAVTLIEVFGPRRIPWAMLLLGLLIGLPVFFEVGFVLLIPIAFTVAHRTRTSLVLVALPMLAGLVTVHAFIPPHPAAVAAVTILHADVGRTIGYALLVGVLAAILGGPVYAQFISRHIVLSGHNEIAQQFLGRDVRTSTPSFALTVSTILLPVLLMLSGGWADRLTSPGTRPNSAAHLLGNPDIALLVGVLVSFITLGLMQGMNRDQMLRLASESLPPTAGALLLIGAGGGFGRILQDSSVSGAIVDLADHAHIPILLMAWLLAALLRIATGSSTVAMTTVAGIVAPLVLRSPGLRPELLVVSTGAGSIILSHVNDGGFWLVKEYLSMDVTQTFKTWSASCTIISVASLFFVLALATLIS